MKVKINKYFLVFYFDFSILPRQMESFFNNNCQPHGRKVRRYQRGIQKP
jgi:hypothetical protein